MPPNIWDFISRRYSIPSFEPIVVLTRKQSLRIAPMLYLPPAIVDVEELRLATNYALFNATKKKRKKKRHVSTRSGWLNGSEVNFPESVLKQRNFVGSRRASSTTIRNANKIPERNDLELKFIATNKSFVERERGRWSHTRALSKRSPPHSSAFNWHPLIGNYQAYPLVETWRKRLKAVYTGWKIRWQRYQYNRGRKVYVGLQRPNTQRRCAYVIPNGCFG